VGFLLQVIQDNQLRADLEVAEAELLFVEVVVVDIQVEVVPGLMQEQPQTVVVAVDRSSMPT
jgi:tRNA nucleotidyltransferase (CCA-adding enzyme)